jgi:hypothetical protein
LRCALITAAVCVPAVGQTIILDNTDPGFSQLAGGAWSTSSGVGEFGIDYRYKSTDDSVGTVEWRPTITVAGDYQVVVWYRSLGVGRPDDATYSVTHGGGTTQVVVNQQTNGSRWVVLGTYTFAVGTNGYVRLTNQAQAGKNIIADAVRFSSEPEPVPLFTEVGAAALGVALDARSGSLADIDGDGDLDLSTQGPTAARMLFRNDTAGAGLSFTDVSSTLHLIGGNIPSWSSAWGDYDGDFDVDMFSGQSNTAPETGDLLRNDGVSGFNDLSAGAGLDDPGFHQSVAWADMDGDLDLDLVLAMEGPEEHEIYIQGPPGQFTPVGASVGFQEPAGVKAYGMAIGDTDGDGDNDIYISTCRGDNNIRNNFFLNLLAQTGSLDFVDIADINGTQFMTNSYAAEFHDFDDDGDLDLFMVGADQQPSKLWRNDGGNVFTDVDTITGHALLSDVGGDLNGGRAIDYDNDGDLDLYFHDHLVFNGSNTARLLYRNDGGWEFTDVTVETGLWAYNEGGYDSTWGDLDLDGDQDLYAATNPSFPERVFENSASNNGNHWLYVRLRGLRSNTTAIGARVYATIDAGTPQARTLRRDANTNAGAFHQNDAPVHFGLGAATQVDRLRIVWPDGSEQLIENAGADQYLAVIFPGDCDADGDVGAGDTDTFLACMLGPAGGLGAGCGCNDFDGDGDVTVHDLRAFQTAYTGD